MKSLPFFSALTLAAVFIACDKDDDKPLTQKEQLLTAKEWRITDITRKSVANPQEDSTILKNCASDDRLVFTAGRNFQLNDHATRCDTTVFQYDGGKWAFNGTQDVLVLNGSKRTQSWKVLTLNDSVMRVQWLDSVAANNKVLKTLSFKNK